MIEKRKATNYPPLAHHAAGEGLKLAFGERYDKLTPRESYLLRVDWLDAIADGCTLEGYRMWVCPEELFTYVTRLLAREARGW